MTDLAQAQSTIASAISNLQLFRDQWGAVENAKAELAKVQSQIETAKKEGAGWKNELKEVQHAYDDILRKAHQEQAKLEKLEGEVKARSKKLADINAALAALPQLEQQLEQFDADIGRKSAEVRGMIATQIKTLRQQQGG
jgi:DNA repair exonuclease SbcCD ATPase subunit